MENILLFGDMSKEDKIDMLFGYAETLKDSLSYKLNVDYEMFDDFVEKNMLIFHRLI